MVGHVSKPHGTSGEVYVWPLTDHLDSTFAPGVELHPAGPDERTPARDLPALTVESRRPYRKGVLVRFAGVDDRNTAELIRGRYLLRPREEVAEREADELFYHELIGATVETVEGEELGKVSEVYELRPADLLEVRGRKGSVLVPYTREAVVSADPETRRIVVDLPEGLLDI